MMKFVVVVCIAFVVCVCLVGGRASPSSPSSSSSTSQPNILFLLVDDLGHYNVGFTSNNTNATTPTINALAAEGMILDRHYVYKYCSPTRSSFVSGRLPVHVNTENRPSSQNGGVDLRMTTIAEKLKGAGYRTFMAGKWHAGAYAEGQLPINRGFDYSIGYLNGEEDHYTHYFGQLGATDMWQTNNYLNGTTGTYGDAIYLNKTMEFIHNVSSEADQGNKKPFFIYHAFQNTHVPLEVPHFFLNSSIEHKSRRKYYGMATFVDSAINNITSLLKEKGLWDNTLVVFSADNGGPTGSGCNYPLRGFKFDSFEGGVRAAAFVSGPLVPPSARGTRSNTVMHIADWYATLSVLANTDPFDNTTAVPPSDSINMWPYIFKGLPSPRDQLVLSAGTILFGQYKLVSDWQFDGYSDQMYPDSKVHPAPPCDKKSGCLFDIESDPNERTDLSDSMPKIKAQLTAALQEASKSFFQTGDDGYVGPFTKCIPWPTVRNETNGFVAPCCYEPALFN